MKELIRPSTMEDVEFVSKHMRVEDVAECKAGGFTASYALRWGLEYSTPCMTLMDPKSNEPGAMLGLVDTDDPLFGKVWLLGTSSIEKNTTTFLRNSKAVLQSLIDQSSYSVLYNYTYVENHVHHRWLKWLGFVFLRRVELTPNHFFYEFVKLTHKD